MPFGRHSLGRAQRATDPRPMSDINVTPLVDVMLVLLVIFIITAPLMTGAIRLDLPQAQADAAAASPAFVTLSVDAAGQAHLDDRPVTPQALEAALAAVARRDPATEVQLRADRRVPYGRIAELMALVHRAGLARLGFVTEAPP
ncbi:MAG: biopolymer transporter ExbD [Comamonadaceae bacterium]|nr:MAG: biopolymer transporter ExbD [Comamonadaceae bacterium]